MLKFVFGEPSELPPENLPEPLPEPTFGWFPEPDDIIVFVAHDPTDQPYRITNPDGSNRYYTNETRNKIYRCDQTTFEPYYNDFMTVKLTNRWEWQRDFENRNTLKQLELWVSPDFGWCDGNDPGVKPYGGEIVYKVIDCGGNRRKGVAIVKDSHGREYVIIEMVSVISVLPPSYSYLDAPQYCQKQNLVTNQITWRTSPQGDMDWLNMCNYKYAAYLVWNQPDNRKEVDFYPPIPFPARLFGYNVTVLQYCLQGSTTLVRVTGDLEGWYVAEESPVPDGLVEPYASITRDDYRLYIECDDWPTPYGTVPNCGWKKV